MVTRSTRLSCTFDPEVRSLPRLDAPPVVRRQKLRTPTLRPPSNPDSACQGASGVSTTLPFQSVLVLRSRLDWAPTGDAAASRSVRPRLQVGAHPRRPDQDPRSGPCLPGVRARQRVRGQGRSGGADHDRWEPSRVLQILAPVDPATMTTVYPGPGPLGGGGGRRVALRADAAARRAGRYADDHQRDLSPVVHVTPVMPERLASSSTCVISRPWASRPQGMSPAQPRETGEVAVGRNPFAAVLDGHGGKPRIGHQVAPGAHVVAKVTKDPPVIGAPARPQRGWGASAGPRRIASRPPRSSAS